MSDVPIQVVVAAFQEEKAADEALQALKEAKWSGLIGIQDAAVLRRDEKDKLHIKETGDWGGGKGAVVGGAVGAVVGLVTGPGAIITGAIGATIGGLAAKLRDSGFPDGRLKQLGEGLTPGTSAIVAIIEHKWVAEMEKQLAEAGAEVVTEALKADIAEQLEAGREVAYTAVAGEDAFAAGRMAAGEDQVEVSSFVETEEGIAGRSALVTEEGAVVEGFAVTEEGVAAGAAVLTEEGLAAEGITVTEEGVVAATLVAPAGEEEEEAPAEDTPEADEEEAAEA